MKWAVLATWKMSFEGCKKAAQLLNEGNNCKEAIVEGISIIEDNPAFHSVGYSGLPDCEGHVTLDGGYMDGKTLHFGSIGSVEGFRSPIRIASSLVDKQFNCFLVGAGAEKYAEEHGFEKRDNTYPETMKRYEEEKDKMKNLSAYKGHDTVCFLVKDTVDNICAGVSTSGLFMKEPGRIGDSPVPGAGFYADAFVGAAASTGVGEEIMRASLSHTALMYLKQGMSAQEAAEKTMFEAVESLMERNGTCDSMSMIVMDHEGNFGVGTNIDFPFSYASDEQEPAVYLAHPDGKHVIIEKIVDLSEITQD